MDLWKLLMGWSWTWGHLTETFFAGGYGLSHDQRIMCSQTLNVLMYSMFGNYWTLLEHES